VKNKELRVQQQCFQFHVSSSWIHETPEGFGTILSHVPTTVGLIIVYNRAKVIVDGRTSYFHRILFWNRAIKNQFAVSWFTSRKVHITLVDVIFVNGSQLGTALTRSIHCKRVLTHLTRFELPNRVYQTHSAIPSPWIARYVILDSTKTQNVH